MWVDFVELIRAGIFAAAHACAGSLGGGVLLVSFVLRLGLLPLTLRLARRAREQQKRLAALQPQIARLQRRHKGDPARLWTETRALHRKHDIRLFQPSSLIGWLVQAPLLTGLFAAVRGGLGLRVPFLWIADLARANAVLALVVAAISGAAAALTPAPAAPPTAAYVSAILAALVTFGFLVTASSTVALSVGAGSAVSALQGWLLAREVRHDTTSEQKR